MSHIDATEIIPKLLYIGSAPSIGHALRNADFHVLVLCASEYQPPDRDFPGVQVIHCPLEDVAGEIPSEAARDRLCYAVNVAAKSVRNGRKVLASCLQGRNRSGLVVALVVAELTGCSGTAARRYVQSLREHSLTNYTFTEFLATIPESTTYLRQ